MEIRLEISKTVGIRHTALIEICGLHWKTKTTTPDPDQTRFFLPLAARISTAVFVLCLRINNTNSPLCRDNGGERPTAERPLRMGQLPIEVCWIRWKRSRSFAMRPFCMSRLWSLDFLPHTNGLITWPTIPLHVSLFVSCQRRRNLARHECWPSGTLTVSLIEMVFLFLTSHSIATWRHTKHHLGDAEEWGDQSGTRRLVCIFMSV